MIEIGTIVTIDNRESKFYEKQGVVLEMNSVSAKLHMLDVNTGRTLDGLLPTKTGIDIKLSHLKELDTNITDAYLIVCNSKLIFFRGNDELITGVIDKIFKTTDNTKVYIYHCEKIRSFTKNINLMKI